MGSDAFRSNGPPIFIVGFPRSGTTLLASLIARHPDVALPPETGLLLPAQYWSIRQHWNNAAPPPSSACARLIRDLGLDVDTVQAVVRESPHRGPQAFLHSLLSCYALRQGKPRWAEKSPLHLHYLKRLLRWYPTARVVCLTRDGRDAVPSLMKLPRRSQSIYRHAQSWNLAIDTGRRWTRRRPQSSC